MQEQVQLIAQGEAMRRGEHRVWRFIMALTLTAILFVLMSAGAAMLWETLV
jgi:hypothetical protein